MPGLMLLLVSAALTLLVSAVVLRAAPGWRLFAGNLVRRPVTRRYPRGSRLANVPTGFRGMLEFDAPLCLACRACAHVCPTDAVAFSEKPWGYRVSFSMAQCISCGRCQEECPTMAVRLTNAFSIVKPGSDDLAISGDAGFETCIDCGEKTLPVMPFLRQLYHGLPSSLQENYSRCPRCRLRTEAVTFRDRLRQALQDGADQELGPGPDGEDPTRVDRDAE